MWLPFGMFSAAERGPGQIPLVSIVASVIAADGGSGQIPVETIVAGAIALTSAVTVAWVGFRGTLRTSDTSRSVAFDQRVDNRNAYLEKRLEEMTADRDRYRELYAQMRLDVMELGIDPDELGKGATST